MAPPSNIILIPLSGLYRAVTRSRVALYRAGILATQKIAAPVISVGNITTGGTGKTPFVIWLARNLADTGQRVCILTRGYGRTDTSKQVVVSDGQHVLAKASDGGDEPLLLAENLLGVAAVISNANRVSAARWAIENLNSSVFIMDDGFQHFAIERDLNIVLIDATNPWGGGKLLPRGRLREPLHELKRADAIIITRSNVVSEIDSLHADVQRHSNGKPVILSQTHTVRVRRLNVTEEKKEEWSVMDLQSRPVAAFCALGNSEAFFAHVRTDGYKVVGSTSFRDHHVYTQSDIERLTLEARELGAQWMITTAKDEVKLRQCRFDIPCYVLEIDLSLDDEPQFMEMVAKAVNEPRDK